MAKGTKFTEFGLNQLGLIEVEPGVWRKPCISQVSNMPDEKPKPIFLSSLMAQEEHRIFIKPIFLSSLMAQEEHRIFIKPISVNQAWKGRRFKTNLYKDYESQMLKMLPDMKVNGGKLEIHFIFAFSNKMADVTNPIKMTEDILTKKYGFNDNMVYRMVVEKEIVKKGAEHIRFTIKEIN